MTSQSARNVSASVSRFTPCPDVLVDLYSHTTALVWGKICRYSQMDEGICRASLERLALEMGLTDETIAKHVKKLEEGQYVQDMTPDLRNRPHIYKDTEKLRLKVNIAMDEVYTTKKIGSHYRKNRYEVTTTKGREENQNVFTAYEQIFGVPLTQTTADKLKYAELEYSTSWVIDALYLAVENSTPTKDKRNWRYCETILIRWKLSGKDDGKKGKPAPTVNEALKKAGYDV